MNMRVLVAAVSLAVLAGCAGMEQSGGKRELMIVGNDEKVSWDADGKNVFLPPGKDTVLVIDIGTDPLAPKILANLPLMNSIFGPPVNLAITPDEGLALVANSMDWDADGKNVFLPPGKDTVLVIDIGTNTVS